MRQFSAILVAIYLLIGIGTGVAHYAKGEKSGRSENDGRRPALDAAMIALAWPIHIRDILAGHDPR